MAHEYRSLQQWSQWLSEQPLGNAVLASEQRVLTQLIGSYLGKQALLIGTATQSELLRATQLPCQTIVTPLTHAKTTHILVEGNLNELPLLTGTIDLVILPHTLEFVANPRQLLAEACRMVKPEGLIAVVGFNPYSFFGIKKILNGRKKIASMPWLKNLISLQQIKNWLKLADFVLEQQQFCFYQLPINRMKVNDTLEKIGRHCVPSIGGIYTVVARAKLLPLTPIKMKWKQKLSGIAIPTAISGHIVRHSK